MASAWEIQSAEVQEMADRLGFTVDSPDDAELPKWVEKMLRLLSSLEPTVPEPDSTPSREYSWATRERDPLNAFITFCDVAGHGEGPLRGLRLAVKDCIAVAGLPLTDGGGREPYPVPSTDAVVVERLLAAGTHLVGKTNMEDMAVGSGVGSHFGPTRNPRNYGYQAGGSSSGSAAAVGAGLADVGLGTDQAGSVRIPAAWCGLVGIKPSHGLVPTQGMSRMDPTLDHVGPITRDVATNALVLGCLTGQPDAYVAESEALPGVTSTGDNERQFLRGMRVGTISESVHSVSLTDDVRRSFDHGIEILRRLGAIVEETEVPLWTSSLAIFTGVVAHGLLGTWTSGGCGFGTEDLLDPRVVEHAPSRSHLRSTALPGRVLTRLLLATHIHRHLGGAPITRALNSRVALKHQIDASLEQFDLLVTPTVCKVADPVPDVTPTREALVLGVGAELVNTVPLDLSGHPALSLPCREADNGLPVGFQLIGRRHGEATMYRVASALERALK